MGLFNSLFSGGSSAPSAADFKRIIPEIQSARDRGSLTRVVDKYGAMDDPSIQYTLDVQHLMLGAPTEAKKHYQQSIAHGLTNQSKYYDTLHADSIGQSFTHLLTQFSAGSDTDATEKATALAYCYLSRCIARHGNQAHDSLRTRAVLLKDHENQFALQNFRLTYLGMGSVVEPLLISDFVRSAQGFQGSNPAIARENLTNARALHRQLDDMSIGERDADEYSLEEMADLGRVRHEIAFGEVEKAFKAGRFNLTPAQARTLG